MICSGSIASVSYTHLDVYKRQIIENPSFLNTYTGFENLKLIADLKRIADDKAICDALERVGLDPKDKRKFKKYSLGMKRCV